MNDSTLKELKIVVERCVRPVRARLARKRKMREELLAHLVSIFEEESEKLGDEQAALDRARRRFGDPRELSAELQRTVPCWDRLKSVLERPDKLLYYYDSRESWLRLAGRHLLLMGGGYTTCMMLMSLVVVLARGRQAEIGFMFRVSIVSGLLAAGLSFLAVTLAYEIGRSLYGSPSERSMRRVVLCCLGSLFIFPAVGFFVYWLLTWDFAASLVQLRLACCFAPVAPIALVLASRPFLEERRYEEEWASLQIDQ
jgi:hypothetical protein